MSVQQATNIELRKKTTLRLGGFVPYFYHVRTQEELASLAQISKEIGLPIRLLGGGSNILASDESLYQGKYLEFAVAQIQIHLENEEKFQEAFIWLDDDLTPPLVKQAFQEGWSEKALRLEVGAGMALPTLLKACANSGASGLEGLCGIPGKVGGAIAMNAGAYACEMDQVLENVTVYSEEHGFLTLDRSQFINTYRSFTPLYQGVPVEDYIICQASLVFPFIKRDLVKTKISENLLTKKASQPIKAYTAGCVFKNPTILQDGQEVSVSAGKLLDEAGFKGFEKNGMRLSHIHANFLENIGYGNSGDALAIIEEAKNKIMQLHNIELHEEVRLWL